MDLTDEQWEILKPLLIPVPPRRSDGKGRPWRDPRDVLNAILLWVFLRTGALPGTTCPSATLPTKPATAAASSGGLRRACWRRSFGQLAQDLSKERKERGGLDLSECFIDATFVGAKKGERRWERPSGARAHEAQDGAGSRFWSSYLHMRGER